MICTPADALRLLLFSCYYDRMSQEMPVPRVEAEEELDIKAEIARLTPLAEAKGLTLQKYLEILQLRNIDNEEWKRRKHYPIKKFLESGRGPTQDERDEFLKLTKLQSNEITLTQDQMDRLKVLYPKFEKPKPQNRYRG
jgi:hypothetical protein